MVLAALILILSTAFFFFYRQATCQRILRQQFDQEYFLAIVNASGLEFPAVRRTLGELNAPVDYPWAHDAQVRFPGTYLPAQEVPSTCTSAIRVKSGYY